jgi:hypothetical protein
MGHQVRARARVDGDMKETTRLCIGRRAGVVQAARAARPHPERRIAGAATPVNAEWSAATSMVDAGVRRQSAGAEAPSDTVTRSPGTTWGGEVKGRGVWDLGVGVWALWFGV